MRGEAFIEGLFHGGDGSVSDGRLSIPYAEIRDTAAEWDAWLERNGVSRAECIALATTSGARSAVALLALLARGQSVLLWREPIDPDRARANVSGLPAFCRAALVETSATHDGERTARPGTYRVLRFRPEPSPSPEAGDSYVYLPTSGTTGTPKIVAYAAETLVDNARNCVQRFRLASADRVLVPVPLAHMYGLGAALLPAVSVGASVRLIPDANLLSFLRAEAESDPTAAFLTPSFSHLLVKGRKRARPYRLTVLAGDRAEPEDFTAYEHRHGCTVQLYGSAELGAICAGSLEDPYEARRDTVGPPLPGVELAPPRAGEAAGGAGTPFPLRFHHPYGCAGYADEKGRPVMPSSLFRDGWFRTRDLGRTDGDGRLQIEGRSDHTVKRDGFLVAFADVERALRRVDAIEGAVVVSGRRTSRGRELVAVCTVRPGAPGDVAAWRRSALRLLPGHAVPDRFVLVDELPLTATAKPDRMALAALALEEGGRASGA